MNQPLKARSSEEGGALRTESPSSLMESLSEVLANSASERFEVRVQAWLWLEKHGEAAAGALTASKERSSLPAPLVAECRCREEEPLATWESEFLILHIASKSAVLTPREARLLRASLGADGPPQPLARIALTLGLTRERVRQIEAGALAKLGLRLPKGIHKSPGGRWKRARIVVRELSSPRAPYPGTSQTPPAVEDGLQ